jgi:hypothetical protein
VDPGVVDRLAVSGVVRSDDEELDAVSPGF